jgi:hypothetical protein
LFILQAMLKMSGDPLLEIAKSLLRQRGYNADRALSKWRDVQVEQSFDRVVAQAKKIHEEDALLPLRSVQRSSSDLDADAAPDEDRWTSQRWLEALDFSSIIHEELFAPLRRDSYDEGLDKAYVIALGKYSTSAPIMGALNKKLVERMSTLLHDAARRLGDAVRIAGVQGGETSKFFDSGEGEAVLAFGEQSYFFRGLDRFIGPPNPNLQETMRYEHCESLDSETEFAVNNYGTRTTPQIEYWFVVDPSPARLEKLGIEEFPSEEHLQQSEASAVISGGEEEIESVRAERRKPRSIKSFATQIAEQNGLLKDKNLYPISTEEFYSARLYTGCAPCRSLPPSKRAALALLLRVRDPSRGRH